MTIHNHTATALIVASVTQHSDNLEKTGIVVILALSHIAADAIPHGHYFDIRKIFQTWHGMILELGLSIILTLLTWLIIASSLWWLVLCIISANFFDLPAACIKSVRRFNHLLHWWDKNYDYPNKLRWRWEIVETIALFSFLFFIIFRSL